MENMAWLAGEERGGGGVAWHGGGEDLGEGRVTKSEQRMSNIELSFFWLDWWTDVRMQGQER